MSVVLSFINEDASKQKFLTPTIAKVYDTKVYMYPEFPDFSIHVKGNCDISIGYMADKFSTLEGKLLVIDSKISIQHIKLQGNVLFDNCTITLLEGDIKESDFIGTTMEGGFIDASKSKILSSDVKTEGTTISDTEISNSTFNFMGLEAKGAKINKCNITGTESHFIANFFGSTSNIDLKWDKEYNPLKQYVACIGTHPEMSSQSNLFGIYRNNADHVGFSSFGTLDDEKLILDTVYLNGALYPIDGTGFALKQV